MGERLNNIKKIILAGLFIMVIVIPPKVLAIKDTFYASNGIFFFDPEEVCPVDNPLTPSSVVSISKTDSITHVFDKLKDGGMSVIQAAAIMGNMYVDSNFNSDTHEEGNDIGYGLMQWSFDRRSSLEQYANDKGSEVSDIDTQIEFLLSEYTSTYEIKLNNTPFKLGLDLSESTRAWMTYYENLALTPLNDPAQLNSERIPAAKKIYELYSETGALPVSSQPNGVTKMGCNSSDNGAVAGDIISTAINFALESPAKEGTLSKEDAKGTYQTAKEQYMPQSQWSDCGGFVATVMRASGVDTNYPLGTSVQENYVRSHTEKYTIIDNPNASDLQPGDILLTTDVGHTNIYTGRAGYPIVEASLNHHVPSAEGVEAQNWIINNGAFIVRIIK